MKSFSKRTVSAVALAIVVACAYSLPASADERCTNSTVAAQETLDVEGNGHLTASAHQASAANRFEVMDTNHDGKVTASEIGGSRGAESIAWAGQMTSAKEKLSQLDTNRDGTLTVKEYADSSQKVFNNLDVDGNGVLSDSEMLMTSRRNAR
jgi:Ca2+-binding EF-hand superfamily protein